MANIHNVLTIIGYRFGHQSGLDESSGRNLNIFPHGFALLVYFVFSKIGKTHKTLQILTKADMFQKGVLFFKETSACGKPETP